MDLPPKSRRGRVTRGSDFGANHAAKWVNFRCNSTVGGLEPGKVGFEFYTEASARFQSHPMYHYWYPGDEGVYLIDDQTAAIDILITDMTPELLDVLPPSIQKIVQENFFMAKELGLIE